MRKFRTLIGILTGFTVVLGFASAIHAANVFFSQAIYTRDAQEAARRIERDLQDYMQHRRTAAAEQALQPLAEPPLRLSIDSMDGDRAARRAPAIRFQPSPPSTELTVTEFMSHLEGNELVATMAIVWFAEKTPSVADSTVLSRLPERQITELTPRIDRLLDGDLGDTTLPVDVPSNYLGKREGVTLLAVPIREHGRTLGAMILSYNQEMTGLFLNDVIRIGVAVMMAMVFAAMGLAAFFVWSRFRDRLHASKTIQFLAHHDALTGLPNRTVFSTKLNEALRLAHAKATNIAVLLIDVDKFKDVNDTHGHAAGDLFLQVISDRLSSVFGDHLVARLSGDEFAVLIARDSSRKTVTRLAANMIAATKVPTRIDGKDIPISLSIGVAQATEAAWRSSRLLHCADLALYRAKHSGRSTYVWYSPEMDADAQKRKILETDLRNALKQDEFRLLYQPQFSLSDLRLTGYETLLRWEHPERGTISPTVFIPIAEDAGLIEEIGSWVLNRACHEAARWRDTSLTIAVNVSPAQFSPGKTEQRVAEALKTSGLAPERLEVEITESLLISDTEAVVKTLTSIRQMGASVAMDDFGTGYSSLSYLSRFPFDTIKIDRSFVATVGKNPTTDAIIASIVGLGRSLGVTITAEGVENEDQVTLLRAAGCDKVQGFLFGRPMDLSDKTAHHNAALAQQAKRDALLLPPALGDEKVALTRETPTAPGLAPEGADAQVADSVPDDRPDAATTAADDASAEHRSKVA
ncbi:putative bifunctional diguanylate cyclase/phosphodiesterase [Stappia sp.]|uniref:putative bifunctional diguanylate cyclase/phosphodiesterase n=1 Tax=Stappia sp. TaxID=1870903 RepID=UPI003A9928B1